MLAIQWKKAPMSPLAVLVVAALGSGCDAPTEPSRVDTIIDVPASIDATGETDVTAELSAFFASVADTSTIRFPAEATYRVEGTLLLKNRHHITLEGNGAMIFATSDGRDVPPPDEEFAHKWPRKRSQFALLGGSNWTVRNLKVRGANPNAGTGESAFVVELEAQHGFDIEGVDGVELENVTVTDVYGDFVYLGLWAVGNGEWASNVHIHDSHFERNGRQGIAITGAEDVLIERNYMGEVRRAHFDIEPNFTRGGARRITIRDNDFGPGRLMFLAAAGAAGIVDGVSIEGNRLKGKPMNILVRPPEGSRRSNIRIINNVSDGVFGSPTALMQFYRIDGIEVRGNINPLAAGRSMTAVHAEQSCGVNVSGNTFRNAEQVSRVVPYDC